MLAVGGQTWCLVFAKEFGHFVHERLMVAQGVVDQRDRVIEVASVEVVAGAGVAVVEGFRNYPWAIL